LRLFSVGAGGALLDGGAGLLVVVVVVVEVVDGAWFPLVPQAAVNMPTAIKTTLPATAALLRRSTQRESICSSSVGT
jgi:hypothetical protein